MLVNLDELKSACPCGIKHELSVEEIIIEAGALNYLSEKIQKYNISKGKVVVICDENTNQAAGSVLEGYCSELLKIQLDSNQLHANEVAVEQVLTQLHQEATLLLALGSGTIHDITRYVAWKSKIPFISIPTAASVDGFVSTVAAMTWYGFKKTLEAVAPVCVIADTDIFSKAPYRLTASGISDLLGKYTALCDWKIAHLVTGEYLCEKVCELEYQALHTVCSNISDIRQGDPKACEQLMYGLILSGLAMQMVGNSRPASGAEHHLSHFWEMEIINSYLPYYHGEKVGVGLVIASKIYHQFKDKLRLGISLKNYQGMELSLLDDLCSSKGLYEAILEENRKDPLVDIDFDKVKASIEDMIAIIEEIPMPDQLIELLRSAGAPYQLEQIGLSTEEEDISVKASCYVRNRLTLMRLRKLWGE